MSDIISPEELTKILVETVAKYGGEVTDEIEKGVMRTAKEVRKELASNLAPCGKVSLVRGYKHYNEQFTIENDKRVRGQQYIKDSNAKHGYKYNGSKPYTVTIWNRQSSLIHLLENGHLNRDGTTRTRAFPHMKPANELAERRIDELLRRYNK